MGESQRLRMKDLPSEERPYEKLTKYGADALSNAELLAIILKTGTKDTRVIDVARNIIALNGNSGDLTSLRTLSIEQLQTVEGIGPVKSIQIKAIMELSNRIARQQALKRVKISSPQSIAAVYMEEMRYLKQECCKIVFLNTKNEITGDKVLSLGSVNASIVDPREVFVQALTHNAVHIILLHNHPSGDPSPSREDINITKRVWEGGELIGVNLLDHIIIGDGRYTSLKEFGTI